MSIQWTIIATFLYVEIAVVLLLVLPVANPKRWRSIFRSRFLAAFSRQASLYFYVLLFILVLFLLDAIREMRKYSSAEAHDKSQGHVHLDLEMQVNMRLFRAQRNFYISGFALFLSLVIRRLCSLISALALSQAQVGAALKQAESAATAAKELVADAGFVKTNSANEAHDNEVKALKSEISKLKIELDSANANTEAMKKQSESLNKEYDRLSDEYNKLQKRIQQGSEGDKKEN